MRIAIVHNTLAERGGAEVAVTQVAFELGQLGHEAVIFTTRYEPNQFPQKIRENLQVKTFETGRPLWSMPWVGLPDFFLHTLRVGGSIVESIKGENFDVTVGFNFPSPWIVSAVPTLKIWYCQEPTVLLYGSITQREFNPYHAGNLIQASVRKMYRDHDRRTVSKIDALVSNSNFTSNLVKTVYGQVSSVDHLGVDPDLYKPIENRLRKEFGFENDRIVLIAARLFPVKCVGDIILATKEIVKNDKHLKTIICGTGPDESRLKTMTRELGLSSHVIFWGDALQVKMPAHYAMADVIVNLSMYEPFGLIPIEAMACGRPVVVYDSGGPSETVEDGVTGFKVKPRDIGALSRSISTILRDGSLAKQMGERGRARVLENYTWDLTAKRLLESIRLAS